MPPGHFLGQARANLGTSARTSEPDQSRPAETKHKQVTPKESQAEPKENQAKPSTAKGKAKARGLGQAGLGPGAS